MKKYQSAYYILGIFFITICFFCFLKNNIYSPYSDIGREFYIPSQIADGKILYKDIFNVYAPFGYWFNALFIKIFGNNLNTFFMIGLLLSLLNLAAIYKITKFYSDNNIAFLTAISVIPLCVFFPSISNWITPYSYSILYALAGFLWALYFLIRYIDSDKKCYLTFCCFLYGFSISSKYEFSLFLFVILGIMLYKKENIHIIIKSLLSGLFFPLLSMVILLFQNCTFNDLYNSFLYMIKLANSNSAKYFYFYNGFIPSPESVKNTVLSLTHIFSRFQPDSNRLQFSGYLLTILFVFFTIKLFLKRKNNNKKYILLYTLICSAFITSIKVAGSISLEIYGTYFIPVILAAFISFFTFSENKNKVKYCIIITFLCILTIYYTIADVKNIKKENLCTLNTAKGKINISSIYINETIELLEYINKNTKSSDKILIFPEGAIINYLSDRSSDDELYYLIPPNVEIFGKENISKRILSEYPEYIIITNIMIYEDFAQGSFSKTWGKSITEKINENYILEEVIGQDFKLNVYSHH